MAKGTLTKKHEIMRVLRSGQRHTGEYVTFYWKEDEVSKSAISCGKKCLKRAVDRNYFKRLNRSFLQSHTTANQHRHMLITARPRISEVPRKNMKQVIQGAWKSFLEQPGAAYYSS